ncbi:hypothetical protein ACI6Q2_17150 [Chitinophagaceae bacterium LWZ2-11]
MKSKYFLFAISVLLLASCSSTNKASKTPDDVYYSPGGQGVQKNTTKNYRDEYDEYISSTDDRYLQMKVQNRDLWSSLDDYSYWNAPTYAYNSYYGMPYYNNYFSAGYGYNPFVSFYNPFNPFYMGSGFGFGFGSGFCSPFFSIGYTYGYSYYPYYYPGVYYVSKNPAVRLPASNTNRPSLGSYGNRYYNQNNGVYQQNGTNRGYNNYNNNNNTNRPTYTAPARSYTPSSSGSSGGGGGGGASRPVRSGRG